MSRRGTGKAKEGWGWWEPRIQRQQRAKTSQGAPRERGDKPRSSGELQALGMELEAVISNPVPSEGKCLRHMGYCGKLALCPWRGQIGGEENLPAVGPTAAPVSIKPIGLSIIVWTCPRN